MSVCLSVVSYLWVNLDETLQDNPWAPSDEHGGSDVELSTLDDGSRLTDYITGGSRLTDYITGGSRLTDYITGGSRLTDYITGGSRLTD